MQSSQSNAGLKKRDVIHEVQAAAAVKLQVMPSDESNRPAFDSLTAQTFTSLGKNVA